MEAAAGLGSLRLLAAARAFASSLHAFVGLAIVGAAVGGALGVGILARGSLAPPAPRLGQAVPTSFGVISVDQVEELAASNPDRATLGAGLKEIQVALTMTNLLDRPLRYSRDQLSLRVARDGAAIPVSTASIVAGKLRGDAAFRTIYRFVVPQAASDLWVGFDDPGSSTPILIDLGNGRIPVGVSSAYNPHLHGVGR